ncbi:MAG: hypothetical protein ACR2NU_13485 [Aeoliella sp.]
MHDTPANPLMQPDCPYCGGQTLVVSPTCQHCGRELSRSTAAPADAARPEVSAAKPWMDIDFGAPPPPPPPAPVAEPAIRTTPPADLPPPAAFVEELSGQLAREEREGLRQRVRLIVVATCSLLLLVVYFVLLALGP